MTCAICSVPLEKPEERRTVRTRMEPDAPAREVVCCPACAERLDARDEIAYQVHLAYVDSVIGVEELKIDWTPPEISMASFPPTKIDQIGVACGLISEVLKIVALGLVIAWIIMGMTQP